MSKRTTILNFQELARAANKKRKEGKTKEEEKKMKSWNHNTVKDHVLAYEQQYRNPDIDITMLDAPDEELDDELLALATGDSERPPAGLSAGPTRAQELDDPYCFSFRQVERRIIQDIIDENPEAYHQLDKLAEIVDQRRRIEAPELDGKARWFLHAKFMERHWKEFGRIYLESEEIEENGTIMKAIVHERYCMWTPQEEDELIAAENAAKVFAESEAYEKQEEEIIVESVEVIDRVETNAPAEPNPDKSPSVAPRHQPVSKTGPL